METTQTRTASCAVSTLTYYTGSFRFALGKLSSIFTGVKMADTSKDGLLQRCFTEINTKKTLEVLSLLRPIKTSKVFLELIFAAFLPDYIYFVSQWHSQPSFMKIVDVFDLYTP